MKPLADVLRDMVTGQRRAATLHDQRGDAACEGGDYAGAWAHWDEADRCRKRLRETLGQLSELGRARE